jgi:hypothetical protein
MIIKNIGSEDHMLISIRRGEARCGEWEEEGFD